MALRSRVLSALALVALAAWASACGGGGAATSDGEVLPAFCNAAAGALRPPRTDRPRYVVELSLDPAARAVSGSMRVTFTPDSDTDRLIFRLWPNGPAQHGSRLAVTGMRVGGLPVDTELPDPTTLVAPLDHALRAGEEVDAMLRFRLRLPRAGGDRIGTDGRVMQLGSFLPILPWEPGQGWALDPPTTSRAEASTSPSADWDVTIHAPKGAAVLATGAETESGHWEASAVRDFAVAAGDFRLARVTAHAPRDVAVTVAVARGLGTDPVELAGEVQSGLERLSRDYGAYPWPAFGMAVLPGLGDAGIEYPNIVFEGETANAFVTDHELAHQWFYSLVGNDQARDPWLDEALATWAGARMSGNLAGVMSATVPSVAGRHLGDPMRFWDRWSEKVYELGVYVQGAQALGGSGSELGIRCVLRRYVQRNAYAIATPRDLLDALAAVYPDGPSRFADYGVADPS